MKIIAHRGASGYAPENTISAFKLAVEIGVKAIEFDVQMTKDREIIVHHDYFLGRTVDGKGLIMNKTLAELKNLDAGIWFSKEFEGEKIPTLKEVLEVVPEDIEVYIEIKKLIIDKREIEKEVFRIVSEAGRIENSIFSSFNHECLKLLIGLYTVKIGVLVSSNLVEPVKYLADNNLNKYSFNQSAAFINEQIVKDMHDAGLKVLIYTVNEKEIAEQMEEWGVDGIFSNYPDIITK
ncbi:MAG: glycerophosphodiester phosphodiesterase family protein [Bacillota bacterium]|nr:glycerophosphodiester phosphodiesterase family protein [Bacillota bacterium]